MALPTGYYTIHNLDKLVGRDLHEDHSLNPKHIWNDTTDKKAVFFIQKHESGSYKISSKGAPTGVSEDGRFVVAFFHPRDTVIYWDIKPVRGLKDTYEIFAQHHFWYVPQPGKHCPIEVSPPWHGADEATIPNPQYLFTIKPAPINHAEGAE
ncbi:hypothetical protein AMATHDRAFT_50745 [Amanita thiersii Skay4041]|uniref:Uncharacterized protein n=1 Tax=Amanita thiersii Skay4041 TaxID=703135 RepID=A0A2A9NF00_9AGAR|nr:hypothetical protein AMATHDRAFT_50745 [Amanita thiersii Skay4041]